MHLAQFLSAATWARIRDRAEPAIIFGVALAVLLIVRHFALRWAAARARNTRYGIEAVDAFRFPTLLWVLVGALQIAIRYADFPPKIDALAETLVRIFVIVSISLVMAALSVRMVKLFGERRNLPFAVAGLSRTLTYIVVLSIGLLMLLDAFRIDIKPILTALGVGGLAVALALQDTLANFFAGIHILVEAPISVGDYIKLSPPATEEGTVTDIGWRTTRLRTLANSIVVVPNTRITSGILTNFRIPEARTGTDVAILVGLDADLERVRRIVLEETPQAEGVVPDFQPLFFCDPGVLPTHIQVKVVFQAGSRAAMGLVQSAVRMRITARLKAEGIPLPDARLGMVKM